MEPGPKEGTPEHAKLAHDIGYGYHNLLGEVLYAYVLCSSRYLLCHVTTLAAKFSINPAIEHYRALKCLTVYLRRQISWGIIYWRPVRLSTLPEVKIERDIPGAELPSVPWPSSYMDPGTYV